MASRIFLGLALLMSVWFTKCDRIPAGLHHMECRDRFFVIAVDASIAGTDPFFEAIDATGVHLISERYAAVCGYTVMTCVDTRRLLLVASYFSCHTENQDDQVFQFNFNLKVTHDGKEVSYFLNKTCSPMLPWSPREVACMMNYMEVSVRSDVACPTGTRKDDWNAPVQTAYNSATADWQVLFQRGDEHLTPMNLADAHEQGYVFELTDGRLVFRAPYGQPDSFHTEVHGVPVEVVHATLFSRQSWVVLMVDLVTTCSVADSSFDDGYMTWETPELLHPPASRMYNTRVNIGVHGELVDPSVAEERGYIVEKHNATVLISVPYNAVGTLRKSVVMGDLYEFFIFPLYLEQISVDEDHVETRIRSQRGLSTPLLPHPVFTEDRTVHEESVFTIYLGDVPKDVELMAVQLNGHVDQAPFTNTRDHSITKIVHPNNTHSYILKVPYYDPIVIQQFSKDQTMEHILDINCTLMVLPEKEPFYHQMSVMALTDVSPPDLEVECLESGMSFKMDHRPYDYLWYITIDSDRLTPELADQRNYSMSNDSQSLVLEVPLFTSGYEYKDISLKGFHGSFELLIRDQETSDIKKATVKTCPFTVPEFILCSTDGRMTVVADLSSASGGIPARTTLFDASCGPKEADDERVLFSFPIHSCGSKAMLYKEYVTYENEIFFNQRYLKPDSRHNIDGVKVQCIYPVAGLHRLFSLHKFESDMNGVGRIIHPAQTPAVQQKQEFAPVFQTTVPVTRRIKPVLKKPVKYIKVIPGFPQIQMTPGNF